MNTMIAIAGVKSWYSVNTRAKTRGRLRQRGAALLTAMLTVALVATLAAAVLWQQWRDVSARRPPA